MSVGDIRPGSNGMNTRRVLQSDRVADIGEFAVLENDKIKLLGEFGERGDEVGRKVRDDIDVCLRGTFSDL